MPAFLRLAAAAALLGAAACSGSTATHPDGGDAGMDEREGCLPGAEYPCDCDGGVGAMLCQYDGGLGACQCPPLVVTDGGAPDGGDAG
jgi:hypothetical protein